ncbi:phasin family protein [Microbaculum marinisediminis]|uniref:Phasin family protein n=1 Tax=Microbaculum marinisediminis TaxID=2931392 RepID=A0AAW5QY22_9HYPH|nr:phasin family protein [Microbaculum sp. A6E488]MCT8972037.1 phasin family protein [Microbaculum sp. A6E488]
MPAKRKPAAEKATNNLMMFNQEAFETAIEMQMGFLETATRFAKEFTDFAVRRAEANSEDLAKFAGAKSPPELLQMQLEHMRAMFEDYTTEANRIIGLAGETIGEGSEAVRSSFLSKEELKKAG